MEWILHRYLSIHQTGLKPFWVIRISRPWILTHNFRLANEPTFGYITQNHSFTFWLRETLTWWLCIDWYSFFVVLLKLICNDFAEVSMKQKKKIIIPQTERLGRGCGINEETNNKYFLSIFHCINQSQGILGHRIWRNVCRMPYSQFRVGVNNLGKIIIIFEDLLLYELFK